MFLIIGAKRVKTENKQGVLVYQGRVTFSVFVMRAGFTEKVALNRNLKEVEGWTSISGRKKKKEISLWFYLLLLRNAFRGL